MDSQDFAKQHVSKALQIVEAAHSLELSLLPIFMEDTAQSGRIYSPKNVADCSVILASHLLWQAKYSHLSGGGYLRLHFQRRLCLWVYRHVVRRVLRKPGDFAGKCRRFSGIKLAACIDMLCFGFIMSSGK